MNDEGGVAVPPVSPQRGARSTSDAAMLQLIVLLLEPQIGFPAHAGWLRWELPLPFEPAGSPPHDEARRGRCCACSHPSQARTRRRRVSCGRVAWAPRPTIADIGERPWCGIGTITLCHNSRIGTRSGKNFARLLACSPYVAVKAVDAGQTSVL